MPGYLRDPARRSRGAPAGTPPGPAARAVALVAAAALVLASCTNYQSRLTAPEVARPEDGVGTDALMAPRPAKEKRSVWSEEEVTGEVRLRFDVSETGEVANVEVLEASDPRLAELAAQRLASWPFEPATVGGAPVAVEGVETVMVFYTDDSTTTGEVIGYTLLIVVLLPIALILGAAGSGSFHWGND
jgi:TonB family protein